MGTMKPGDSADEDRRHLWKGIYRHFSNPPAHSFNNKQRDAVYISTEEDLIVHFISCSQ
jgi:hypothetical protein